MNGNLYSWYEENIGPITPIMAKLLKEAEEQYPEEWLREAFQIAVEREARNWSYVKAILERWHREGRDGMVYPRNYTAGLPEYDDELEAEAEIEMARELALPWWSFFTGHEYCKRVILPHMAPKRREDGHVVIEADSPYWAEYGSNRFAKGLARWYGMPVVFECACF